VTTHPERQGGATFKQDEEGLRRAYKNETSEGVYYDPSTQTLYVKGTVPTSLSDWAHNAKIPLGLTSRTPRYAQAEEAYWKLQAAGKPIHRVVGHSLGGSVVLGMQKRLGVPYARTFGAPVFHPVPSGAFGWKVERYRHPGDPVSVSDQGATWGPVQVWAHGYDGYQGFDKP
jgi:hypothetical protein